MQEKVIQLILIAVLCVIVYRVLWVIGIGRMTYGIMAMGLLLCMAIVALEVMPFSEVFTEMVKELPVIGYILEAGSIYQYGYADARIIAYEILQMANMMILVELIGNLIDNTGRMGFIIHLLAGMIIALVANVVMIALMENVFLPLARKVCVPGYSEGEIAAAFYLWCFTIVFCVATYFLRGVTRIFSPLIVIKAMVKSFAFVAVIIAIEYYFGDSITQIIFRMKNAIWCIN